MWKSRGRTGHKLNKNKKIFIKKRQDENEELKGSTIELKSQDEKLQNLKQKVQIWEIIKRKWIEALFFHNKQQEALDNQVKALAKKNKDKENVLTYLELINLQNVSLLQFKELGRKTIFAEREQFMEDKKEYKFFFG